MRSKRKELFTKLSDSLSISLMLKKQKDRGARVVANTNQAPAITENPPGGGVKDYWGCAAGWG